MLSGNRHGIAEAECIGFHGTRLTVLAFALVGDKHDRLVGTACEIREGTVGRRQTDPCIDHEHQRISGSDRRFRLLLHPRGERTLRAFIQACGIDQREFEIAEPALAFAAVAGDSWLVIDKRELLPNQPVEQGRLADIGPADDGDRKGHKKSVRPLRTSCQ